MTPETKAARNVQTEIDMLRKLTRATLGSDDDSFAVAYMSALEYLSVEKYNKGLCVDERVVVREELGILTNHVSKYKLDGKQNTKLGQMNGVLYTDYVTRLNSMQFNLINLIGKSYRKSGYIFVAEAYCQHLMRAVVEIYGPQSSEMFQMLYECLLVAFEQRNDFVVVKAFEYFEQHLAEALDKIDLSAPAHAPVLFTLNKIKRTSLLRNLYLDNIHRPEKVESKRIARDLDKWSSFDKSAQSITTEPMLIYGFTVMFTCAHLHIGETSKAQEFCRNQVHAAPDSVKHHMLNFATSVSQVTIRDSKEFRVSTIQALLRMFPGGSLFFTDNAGAAEDDKEVKSASKYFQGVDLLATLTNLIETKSDFKRQEKLFDFAIPLVCQHGDRKSTFVLNDYDHVRSAKTEFFCKHIYEADFAISRGTGFDPSFSKDSIGKIASLLLKSFAPGSTEQAATNFMKGFTDIVGDKGKLRKCGQCSDHGSSSKPLLICGRCKSVFYCSVECQVKHRPMHKKHCKEGRAAALP